MNKRLGASPLGPLLLSTVLLGVVQAATQLQEPLGSERGARVAIELGDGAPQKLVYVSPPREAAELEALRAVAPNVEIRQASSASQALEHAPDAHGIDARFATSEFLRAAPKLRWVQAQSAGVERYLRVTELRERDDIVFTNMKGMHGPAIADHAFAMLLLLTRELRFYEEAQRLESWDRGSRLSPMALHGKTMLVVGLGGIGSEIAKRAKGFGMEVLATARTERPPPPYVDRLEPAAALPELLPASDVVAICVPLTAATEGMIGAEELALMKPGSYLINIARGRICDTDALREALESGHLGGACLDVTDPEPLPPGHPLWKAPNLVITPHVSGRAELTGERRRALFHENLRRFARGEPLLNVVDKVAGY